MTVLSAFTSALRRPEPALAGLALAVRLAYLAGNVHSPFFAEPVVDARTFLEQARSIAAGDWLAGPEPFWQPPLYPYLLAAFCWLIPADVALLGVRVAQHLLGTASCLMVYWLGRRAAGRAVGVSAGVMAALYGPLVYFEGELLSVPVEVALNLLLLLCVCRAIERPRPVSWLLCGAAAGLAVITRPNVGLFVAAVTLWLAWRERCPSVGSWLRRLSTRVGPMALGTALVVLPVTVRNGLLSGDLVWVSSNGGVNFYVGNNARYDSTVAIHPGRHWEMLVTEPVRSGRRSAAERSSYFVHKGLDYIAAHPLEYSALMARKTLLFWQGREIKRNQDPYYARTYSTVLGALMWKHGVFFPFGLIGPLSLLGIGLAWRRREEAARVLLIYSLSYAASVVLFFVTARYRAPAVPALLVFAAWGAAHLQHLARLRRWRTLGVTLGALTAAALPLNAGSIPSPESDAQLQHDLGEVHLRRHDYATAERYLRAAVALEPDYSSAYHNLAVAALEQGRPRQAIARAEQALAIHPVRADTRLTLAQAYLAIGERARAGEQLRESLRLDPGSAAARYHYGHLLLKEGRPAEAVDQLRRALAWRERSYWVHYDLGCALIQTGESGEALAQLRQASAMAPDRPEALVAAGTVLLSQGDLTAARAALEAALEVSPGNAEALANLGVLELAAGAPDAAVRYLERALPRAAHRAAVIAALARAYQAAGQIDRARALLQQE